MYVLLILIPPNIITTKVSLFVSFLFIRGMEKDRVPFIQKKSTVRELHEKLFIDKIYIQAGEIA